MPCNDLYTCFRKVGHYGDNKLMSELEINLKWWLDWAFLKIGGWTPVYSGTNAHFGGNFYTLKPMQAPSYTDGQVWISPRKEWIYETGVNYDTPSININSISSTGGGTATIETTINNYFNEGDTVTISDSLITNFDNTYSISSVNSLSSFEISGVAETGISSEGTVIGHIDPIPVTISLNGQAINTGTSGAEHYINYPLGAVIFDSAINTGTSSVVAQYSFRDVQTYIADSVPWLVESQLDSLRPDSHNWSNIDFLNKGDWGMNPQHRIQLPAIIVEAVGFRGGSPYQLGNHSLLENPQILFYILAQTRYERNNIVSILSNQKHHTIRLFDSDAVAKAGDLPLDYRGMVVSNPNMYPDIIDEYWWKRCWIKDINVSEVKTGHPNLFISTVRFSLEVLIEDSIS